MGRRIRWLYYYLKKLLRIAVILWVAVQGYHYLAKHYNSNVSARAQQILPQIVEVDAAGMERFLRQPQQDTLIFVYSSRSLLSRWYFENMNQIAGKFAGSGVRPLFISIDKSTYDLANFLGAQETLHFVPLHMSPEQAKRFPDVVALLGGDSVGGLLPYMGVMNRSLYLRDFSPAIVRTGKIEEVIYQNLRGG